MRKIDLTGKKFGRLLVLEKAQRPKKAKRWANTNSWWKVQCDCGTIKTLCYANFASRMAKTKSCGCLYLEMQRNAPFRLLLKTYTGAARISGRAWKLSVEQFRQLTSSPCFYTGLPPSKICRVMSGNEYLYNGIDRRNNRRGYTLANCVPCLPEINRMKGTMDEKRFIELCILVAVHQKTALLTGMG